MKRIRTGSRTTAYLTLLLAAFIAPTGCKKDDSQPVLAVEMRDAYTSASKLYGYAWSPKQFNDPKNRKAILALIDSLLSDFHRVELAAPATMFDPSFRLTLTSNQQMLSDIRNRFESGATDYANWRLRSLSTNCVACHSRYEVPTDFIGSAPPLEEATFESEYARAQFLFATRQFEAAQKDLLRLGGSQVEVPSGLNDTLRALKLWLVIEVRVKSEFRQAATALTAIAAKLPSGGDAREMLEAWIDDLNALATRKPLTEDTPVALVREAESLLVGDPSPSSERDDELSLVNHLRASALLHRALQKGPTKPAESTATLRRATFLLGLCYIQLPIDVFETFKELHLEQTIRQFPETREAQRSYLLYQSYIEEQSSGSGGLHLDAEQIQKLRELRKLAFGADAEQLKLPFSDDE